MPCDSFRVSPQGIPHGTTVAKISFPDLRVTVPRIKLQRLRLNHVECVVRTKCMEQFLPCERATENHKQREKWHNRDHERTGLSRNSSILEPTDTNQREHGQKKAGCKLGTHKRQNAEASRQR